MSDKTREQIYDAQISPLMAQIIALCKANDIPLIAGFDLDDDRDSEDRPGLACITSQLPANAAKRFHNAHRALYPQPSVMAFTIVGGQ